MAVLVFALGVVLFVAGLGGFYLSLDLLPTGVGILYALGGAIGVSMAVLAFAVGVLVRRIDALTELARQRPGLVGASQVDAWAPVPLPEARPSAEGRDRTEADKAQEPQAEEAGEPTTEADEERVDENRAEHSLALNEVEHAIETPEAPPSLIGHYSSGGANYMIFADGSIEAETPDGTFKFASMGDFKQYLADRGNGKR
ncbi:MAG TPA: hypothetical protein VFE63_02795 [Roseiarcus sp.]|jgi:hypothetical protein|nr:hypothetical protein [Roseiarcus sp.]